MDYVKAEKIDPSLPLTKIEREMFGGTFRLPLSGWPCQRGSGALSPELQDKIALRKIAADAARPDAVLVEQFTSKPLGAPNTDKPWSY